MRSQRKQYRSDITDTQWSLISHLIPSCKSNKKTGGRPEGYPRREILNTVLYVLSTGCNWSDTPHDLPPGSIACTGLIDGQKRKYL
jgi:transposase